MTRRRHPPADAPLLGELSAKPIEGVGSRNCDGGAAPSTASRSPSPGGGGSNVPEPARDCPLCPRLVEYRGENRAAHPDWFNGPAPSFGDPRARLLVVGLAPGRQGANRTGRPFTGDYAGVLLYETLMRFGFARGEYRASPDDGFELVDAMVTNAVRCAPPQNKPLPVEEATCRAFLAARIAALSRLQVIVALGDVSRRNVFRALGLKPPAGAAGHGARYDLDRYVLFSSYHCSRLNTNTGRLTPAMFAEVFAAARSALGAHAA